MSFYSYLIPTGWEETIECQCSSIISIYNRKQILLVENRIKLLLKENRIPNIVDFQCHYDLTGLNQGSSIQEGITTKSIL